MSPIQTTAASPHLFEPTCVSEGYPALPREHGQQVGVQLDRFVWRMNRMKYKDEVREWRRVGPVDTDLHYRSLQVNDLIAARAPFGSNGESIAQQLSELRTLSKSSSRRDCGIDVPRAGGAEELRTFHAWRKDCEYWGVVDCDVLTVGGPKSITVGELVWVRSGWATGQPQM